MMKWKLSIPPLDGLSLRARIVIALVAILLASLILWSAAEGETQEQEPPISQYEDHLLKLDREALDIAYKEHIKLVFSIWMKDPTDPNSSRRAGNGARNARAGFEKSVQAVERREHRLKETEERTKGR
jgi:hypothetical protein